MKWKSVLSTVWVAGIVVLYAAHFLHLRADFPNFSPWMDYSKYTDEGWYGSGAVRQFISGFWRVPGDFNPAAALPVWPFLEGLLFHFTGVSLVAARFLVLAVFGGNLLLTYALVRMQQKQWVALLAISLVATNAFLYAFSRLAILEPLMIFWTLLSWWLALKLPAVKTTAARYALLAVIGLLLCLSVLTKTTAVALFPAVFYLLWHVSGRRVRAFVQLASVAAGAAIVFWSGYYFLCIKPRFLSDYKYLFQANQFEQPISIGGWIHAFWYAVHGSFWIDKPLVWLAAALLILSPFLVGKIWRNPLFAASLLAAAGYLFFTGWHNNMQPRYYQVVAFPLILASCLGISALWEHRRWMGFAALALALVSIGINLRLMVSFLRHPEYTFVNAAANLTRYIDEHPNGNRLLLSISGANITLATHLPSICDDFGTYDLPHRIHVYKPGWYAAWNELDAGTQEDLQTQYSLEEVAHYDAFDDDDRDVLILYKLHPLPASKQTYDAESEQEVNAGK